MSAFSSFISRRDLGHDSSIRSQVHLLKARQRDEDAESKFGDSSTVENKPLSLIIGNRNSKALIGRTLPDSRIQAMFVAPSTSTSSEKVLNKNETDLFLQFVVDITSREIGGSLLIKNTTTVSSIKKILPDNFDLPTDSKFFQHFNVTNAVVFIRWLGEKSYDYSAISAIHVPSLYRLLEAINGVPLSVTEKKLFSKVLHEVKKEICIHRGATGSGATRPMLTTFLEDILSKIPTRIPTYRKEQAVYSISQGIGKIMLLSNESKLHYTNTNNISFRFSCYLLLQLQVG